MCTDCTHGAHLMWVKLSLEMKQNWGKKNSNIKPGSLSCSCFPKVWFKAFYLQPRGMWWITAVPQQPLFCGRSITHLWSLSVTIARHFDQKYKTVSVINCKSVIAMPSDTTLNKSSTARRLSWRSISGVVSWWGRFYRVDALYINHFLIIYSMQGPGMLTN